MSPVSRGRKRKSQKRSRRQPTAMSVVGEPDRACDCPACVADATDVDAAGAVDAMLADATDLLAIDDPLDAEVAGAVLTSLLAEATSQLEADEVAALQAVATGLVPEFEARATGGAMAVLLALASVAADPVAGAARTATERMARIGVARPLWAEELAVPPTVGECWLLADPLGAGSVLGAAFTRAGRTHGVLVFVDALDCGAAADILMVDEPSEVREELRTAQPPEGGPRVGGAAVVDVDLEPAEWRWQVENALAAREVHDRADADPRAAGWPAPFAPDTDEYDPSMYPALAVLLRARLGHLPVSDKPKPPHSGHDDGPDIDITEFAGRLVRQADGTGRGGSRPGRGVLSTAKLPTKRTRRGGPAPIYQVKVRLRGAKPPIWRRLQLPGDTSLAALHQVIQVAFGWDDYHMHVFSTPYGEFGVPDHELGHRAEAPVTLEQVATAEGAKIGYTYDFGDDWTLDIVVEKLLAAEPGVDYPRCTGGRRAAPPEDCGGVLGYADLVEIMADPGHPEHAERCDWFGLADAAGFDPARFDADEITRALAEPR